MASNERKKPHFRDRKKKSTQCNQGPPYQNIKTEVVNASEFEVYWGRERLQAGLRKGYICEGALRINPRNYEDAYIPHPDGMSDIYIRGVQARNRALNGDIVAVLISDRRHWKIEELKGPSGKVRATVQMDSLNTSVSELDSLMSSLDVSSEPPHEKQSGDCANSTHTLTAETSQRPHIPQKTTAKDHDPQKDAREDTSSNNQQKARKTPKSAKSHRQNTPQKGTQNTPQRSGWQSRNDMTTLSELPGYAFTDAQAQRLFSANHNRPDVIRRRLAAIPDNLLLRTGKVVAVVERKHSRACTGRISLQPGSKAALFRPVDHRIPRLHVPVDDCPPDISTRPEDYAATLFIARLVEWTKIKFAQGQLQRSLGEAGEIEPETDGMLIENGIDFEDFPQQVLDCLPAVSPANPWRIPASELAKRRDLRSECIFTIDPASARDLDDALHCTHLGGDEYEVGVHIADVSHFVTSGNALDAVALSRATSVYLVHKVIPMLPRLLCEQLCSLNPDEDRLTFSVIWRMRETGEILDEWFGKSVIRSVTKLSYDHAQGFIEQPDRAFTEEELPPIATRYGVADIKKGVLNLHKIAQNLRENRLSHGALALNQVKLSFLLDRESALPCGYSVYRQRDSNKLVEEFMLLANMAVAHKIYASFPEHAVLRRHPAPRDKMADDMEQMCRSLGIPMDTSSAASIQRSLLAQEGSSEEQRAKAQVLTVMLSKPMQLARYFCTGALENEQDYRHYALSVPLYTHFTSPIRRYPDIMVHRLLAAAIGCADPPEDASGVLMKRCEHCNDKKKAAKTVSDLSSEMFFSLFVRESGPLEERGIVIAVLDLAFDVLLLNLGVIKRVHLNQLPLESHSFRKNHRCGELTLMWKAGEQHAATVTQHIAIFTHVNCCLLPRDQPLQWKIVIKHPDEPLNSTEPEMIPERVQAEGVRQSEFNFSYEDL